MFLCLASPFLLRSLSPPPFSFFVPLLRCLYSLPVLAPFFTITGGAGGWPRNTAGAHEGQGHGGAWWAGYDAATSAGETIGFTLLNSKKNHNN